MDRSTSHGRRPALRLRPALVAVAMLASMAIPIAAAAEACASSHGRAFLTGLEGGFNAAFPFYRTIEGQNANPRVAATPGDCVSAESTATNQTANGQALAGQDYTASAGSVDKLCDDVHEPTSCSPETASSRPVPIPTSADNPGPEAAVEPFEFRLTGGSLGLAPPTSASVHIIDIHGSNRASMEPSLTGEPMSYQRTEFGHVLIPVFRAGPSSSGSVHFSVTPDPDQPATPGLDFNVDPATASPLQFGSGERLKFIRIDIVGDRLGEGDESVIIELEEGGTLAPADPATATLTIIDNEENVFPVSRFHHPRHKLKYKRDDYRIREVHVFATDEGGSGVVDAQWALRRNLKNGKCRWLTRKGWKGGGCGERRWLGMQFDRVADLFYYRLGALKHSMGKGKIRDYTAFSRSIDGAENMERKFDERRNQNTFEVKKKRKKKRKGR